MKVRLYRDYNSPLCEFAAGEVVDLDGDLATTLLTEGYAEPISDEETATRTGGRKATKATARKEERK